MRNCSTIGWICILTALASNSQAQQRNLLKLNLLSPVAKTFNIQYEREINTARSFQIGLFIIGAKETNGFGITPEYRFYYPLKEDNAPKGFLLAPFIRFQRFNTTSEIYLNNNFVDAKAIYFGVRIGLIAGYQWIFSNKVLCEVFIGPTYSFGDYTIKTQGATTDDFSDFSDFSNTGIIDGYGLRGGICIGFCL